MVMAALSVVRVTMAAAIAIGEHLQTAARLLSVLMFAPDAEARISK